MEASADTPVIVFLSGFPDRADSWLPLEERFRDSHHVVTMSLAGYELSSSPSLTRGRRPFWGYSLYEMSSGLVQVLKSFEGRSSSITLVGHDWGAHICLMSAAELSMDKDRESGDGTVLDKLVLLDVWGKCPCLKP